MKIGVQIYSVREQAEKDFAGTLMQLKQMGYDGVELAGLYGLSVATIVKAAKDADIEIFSAHVPYDELCGDTEGTVETYRQIGCKWIAVPYLMPEHRPQSGNFGETIGNIRKISDVCKSKGIQLLYHNHDFEFYRMPDGKYALDTLYDSIPAENLKTELDTCWVQVSGEDPSAFVRKYSGRAPLVHLKDYDGVRSENMYQLIGIDQKQKSNAKPFGFRPLGGGLLDVPSVYRAACDAGAEWVVVEQDEPAEGQTRMESVQISISYLKSIIG